MRLDVLKAMNSARAGRRAGAIVTRLADGEQRFVAAERIDADPLRDQLETALRMGKSAAVAIEGEDYFLTVQAPSPRLSLIGAVHISQALAPIARIAGLDVSIIDPRTAFATPDRFPDIPVIAKWPDEALSEAPLDRYTAICLLTHDPKIDDPALEIALKAECFYIGALGSRKTHAKTDRADARPEVSMRRRWRGFMRRSGSTSAPSARLKSRSRSSARSSPRCARSRCAPKARRHEIRLDPDRGSRGRGSRARGADRRRFAQEGRHSHPRAPAGVGGGGRGKRRCGAAGGRRHRGERGGAHARHASRRRESALLARRSPGGSTCSLRRRGSRSSAPRRSIGSMRSTRRSPLRPCRPIAPSPMATWSRPSRSFRLQLPPERSRLRSRRRVTRPRSQFGRSGRCASAWSRRCFPG